jgi:hypothetical protein
LAGEDDAEIELLAIEADAAACGHGDDLVVERVVEVGQASVGSRLKPRSALPDSACSAPGAAAHCLAFNEVVELGLLLKKVAAGRLGSLELQGQMHAFVASVLLRVTGLDAFDLDAEPEPPDRQLAEAEERIGACEGNAVVGANGLGQTESLKTASNTGKASDSAPMRIFSVRYPG